MRSTISKFVTEKIAKSSESNPKKGQVYNTEHGLVLITDDTDYLVWITGSSLGELQDCDDYREWLTDDNLISEIVIN